MRNTEAHPITVEVVRSAIVAYADEMANALCKAAYNMMIYEVRDYCCGLIDVQGRMISQNRGGLPIFLADLGVAVEDGIRRWGIDGFKPGDVLIMNHGEVCGQHLNNVVIYCPIFHGGEIVAFAANRAHWIDIGGARIGFGSSATTEIFAEGIQMRSLKIFEEGRRNETLWQIIRDNVRFPDSCLGDLRAQMASCQLGARRYCELLDRYGRATVESCIAKIWDQADSAARQVVESIRDGIYTAESLLDNDGRTLDKPLRIKVRVEVKGSKLTVDFSEMNPQTQSPINSGRSGGIAAARVAFKCLDLARSRRQRGMLSRPRGGPARGYDAQRQAAGGARLVEHRATHGHRYDPQSAGPRPARPDSGRPQRRHGRLLVLRPARRRQPLPADEHFRRRLGRPAA